ncbi:putative septum site-determining protein MinD, partial [Haematococcus lacustris]
MIEKNDMMSVKDVQVIVSTNRGEPLVLQKKLTLSGIAYENAARRLIGKQDYFLDLSNPTKGMFQRFTEMFQG